MNREEFTNLFISIIKQALEAVGNDQSPMCPDLRIELHGAGVSGNILSVQETLDRIWLSDDLFYAIINIDLKSLAKNEMTIFVGVSGHKPCAFDQTWNTPPGNGPFKVIVPLQ